MVAGEVEDGKPKFTWQVGGIYRTPNENMRHIERLLARTGIAGNSTKRSIIGVT
jgi:hypothetical protein